MLLVCCQSAQSVVAAQRLQLTPHSENSKLSMEAKRGSRGQNAKTQESHQTLSGGLATIKTAFIRRASLHQQALNTQCWLLTRDCPLSNTACTTYLDDVVPHDMKKSSVPRPQSEKLPAARVLLA